MERYADASCALKVNVHCEFCKMKVVDVLSSIIGVYSVDIDAREGLAKVYGTVDPNILLGALARTGNHARVAWVSLKHPVLNSHDYYPPPPPPYNYYSDMPYHGCTSYYDHYPYAYGAGRYNPRGHQPWYHSNPFTRRPMRSPATMASDYPFHHGYGYPPRMYDPAPYCNIM